MPESKLSRFEMFRGTQGAGRRARQRWQARQEWARQGKPENNGRKVEAEGGSGDNTRLGASPACPFRVRVRMAAGEAEGHSCLPAPLLPAPFPLHPVRKPASPESIHSIAMSSFSSC